MRTRIYNARILTMEEKRPVFKGEIYIDGGKIFRIKEAKTEKSERTEKPALRRRKMGRRNRRRGKSDYARV